MYYVILTLKPNLLEKGIGSTFLEISKKDTPAIEIKLPSYAQQTASAEILSDMDAETRQSPSGQAGHDASVAHGEGEAYLMSLGGRQAEAMSSQQGIASPLALLGTLVTTCDR